VAGTAYSILGAASVPLAAWLARKFGKGPTLRGALFAGAGALAASFALYTPAAPILSTVAHGLFGVAASGFFWVLLPSMLADVVDFDELESGQRREGAFSSTLSYVLKLGTTITLLLTGPLVEMTGFDARKSLQDPATVTWLRVLFAALPAAAALFAALALRRYPLTRGVMDDIRMRLEARRGAV
jgi:GPH family glycoside/pentoside/hexuronide:cation symporter